MPRVLVVDDQADVRTIISIVLRIQHFEIVEAESAASALKLFEQASFGEASFDLAIVDIFFAGHQRLRSDHNAALPLARPACRCDFRDDRAGLSVRNA